MEEKVKKTGGAWIIVDSSGNIATLGSDPDFGPITSMNSHRSEIYGVLSAILFLHEYCRYFMISLSSNVKDFCDNLEVVSKMKQVIKMSNISTNISKQRITMRFTYSNITSLVNSLLTTFGVAKTSRKRSPN